MEEYIILSVVYVLNILKLNWIMGFSQYRAFFTKFVIIEHRHDKTNKMSVHPAMTQISLGTRPVWSESLLSAWVKFVS